LREQTKGIIPERSGNTLLLVEKPSLIDPKEDNLLVKRESKTLLKLLKLAGISPKQCRVLPIVRCHTSKNKEPTKKAIELCRPWLKDQIKDHPPKQIITLGAVAFSAVHEGSLGSFHGLKIKLDTLPGQPTLIPMYKPDVITENPNLLEIMYDDWDRLRSKKPIQWIDGNYTFGDSRKFASELVGLDCEYSEDGKDLIGVGMSDAPGQARYWLNKDCIPYLRANPIDRVVMFTGKHDLKALHRAGYSFLEPGVFDDVEDAGLLAFCMNKTAMHLKDLMLQELNLEHTTYKDLCPKSSMTLRDVDPEDVRDYCGGDSDGTIRLWLHLWKLATMRERNLYLKYEKPILPVVAQMELTGVPVNIARLEELQRELHDKCEQLLEQLEQLGISREVVASPAQLSKKLYQDLKLPAPQAKGKTDQLPVDKIVLERLRGKHPAIALLLEYRVLGKIKSTYIEPMLYKNEHGLVFPNWNQIGTKTARFSSSNPNFQNLPKKDDRVRSVVVAPEGYIVISIDNSQIDLRCIAWESQDPHLLEIFELDLDVHSETSMRIFGNVEKEKRRICKVANFLTVFGGGYMSLAAKAEIPPEDSMKFMEAYWNRYSKVKDWIAAKRKQMLEDGYVETMFGRRRLLPKLYTPYREAALREGQNMPAQGGTADVIKAQMAATKTQAIPFAQIHDELDFFIPIDNYVERCWELKKAMESIDCPFKLKAEVNAGPNFGDMSLVEFKASDKHYSYSE